MFKLRNKIAAAAVALIAAVTFAPAANAGTVYVVGTYGAAHYGEPMQSFVIPADCTTTGFRWVMPTSPINVRDRLSSLAMFATLPNVVQHCNNLEVVDKITGTKQGKCVAKNNRGMPTLDKLRNDRAGAIILKYNSYCPLYNLAAS